VEAGKELRRFEGHQGYIPCLALFPDGRRAVSGSYDGTVRLWDVETGKEVQPLTGPVGVCLSIAISPDCQRLVSHCADRHVRFWDPPTGRVAQRRDGNGNPFDRVEYSSDGRRLILPKGDGPGILLLDHDTGKEWRKPNVGVACFSPDGRRLFGSGDDFTPELWDWQGDKLLRRFSRYDNNVHCVAYSPDGRRCVSGSSSTLRFHDVETGADLTDLLPWGWHPLFAADGRKLFAVADRITILYDLNSRKEIRRFEGHTGEIQALALAPDGKALASTGRDGRLLLWNSETGEKLREWQLSGPVHALAFAADGRHLATANGNGTVYLLRIGEAPKPGPN
jgi:WD40 repeat protein